MKLFSPAAIALVILIAAPVFAADQMILGTGFQVKNFGTPDQRKVDVKAKEKASPNTIVGDPAMNGATLTVRANGTNPSQQIIALPQGTTSTGKPFWSGSADQGFTYRDSKGEQGPVTKVRLRKSGSGTLSLQAQLSGKVQPLNVVPPNLGTNACVVLQMGGGGDSYSVRFAGGAIANKAEKQYTHKKPLTEGTCAPTCSDGILNGTETDLDCGGASCSGCDDGDSCSLASDCTSGVCTSSVCQVPLCTDGVANGDETDVDCGGSCPLDCTVNQGCVGNDDCMTAHCSGGLCKCPDFLYTFTVNSNVGGAFDSAEWPGGATAQSAAPACGVTINRPNDNIDLACSLAAPFSVNGFAGYSSCFGTGGEDGDGCQPLTCPPAGVGSCCDGRPSCSAAVNGSASAHYFVQCLE